MTIQLTSMLEVSSYSRKFGLISKFQMALRTIPLLGVLYYTHPQANSQFILHYPKPISSVGTIGDVFASEISQIGSLPLEYKLQFSILDTSKSLKIQIVTRPTIWNEQGRLNINRAFFDQQQFSIPKGEDMVQRTGALMLPVGQYYTKIEMLSMGGDLLASADQVWHQTNQPPKQPIIQKGGISSIGTFEQIFGWANSVPQGSEIPGFIIEARAQPQFNIYGIPIEARLTISSLNGIGYQNPNQMTLRFDGEKLKRELTGIVLREVHRDQTLRQQFSNRDRALGKELSRLKSAYPDSIIDGLQTNLDGYSKFSDSLSSVNAVLDSLANDLASKNPHLSSEEIQDSLSKLRVADSLLNMEKKWSDSLVQIQKRIPNPQQVKADLERLNALSQYLKIQFPGASINEIMTDIPSKKGSTPSELIKAGKLPQGLKWLLFIDDLSVGTVQPIFSPLTALGQRMEGVSFALSHKWIFAKFAHGEIRNPMSNNIHMNGSYLRNGFGGQIGFGDAKKSHIKFTLFHGKDDASSINPRDSIFTSIITPQSNHVLSLSGKVQILDGRFFMNYETAISHTIRDVSDTTIPLANWFPSIFKVKNETNVFQDWAGQVQLHCLSNRLGLDFMAGLARIGNGFRSFGLPFIQPDILLLETKMTKRLWRSALRMSMVFRRSINNLDGEKPFTTSRTLIGGDIRFQKRKWPTLFVSYNPVQMGADTTTFMLHPILGNLTWDFKWKKTPIRLSLTYNHQFTESTNPVYVFQLKNFTSELTFQLSKNWYASLTGSLIDHFQLTTGRQQGTNVGIGMGGVPHKKVSLDGNFIVWHQNSSEISLGGFFQCRYQFNSFLYFLNRFDYNQYSSILPSGVSPLVPSFLRFQLRFTLGVQW